MQKKRGIYLIASLMLAILIGFGAQGAGAQYPDPGTTEPTSVPTSGTPASGLNSTAAIILRSPGNSANLNGQRVTLNVIVSGLKLDGLAIGKPAAAGLGHWAMFVDGTYAGVSVSDVASVPNDAYPRLTAGVHRLAVELRNNDRSPIAASRKEISVTIASDMTYTPGTGSPAISIVNPPAGAAVGNRVDVQVGISGFTLDGNRIGTANTPGIGHWQAFVDDQYAGLAVSERLSIPNDALPNLTPGQHRLSVALHNNDFSPLAGALSQTVTITIGIPQSQVSPAPASPSALVLTGTATVGSVVASPTAMMASPTAAMMVSPTVGFTVVAEPIEARTTRTAEALASATAAMMMASPTAAVMMASPTAMMVNTPQVADDSTLVATPPANTANPNVPGLPRTGTLDNSGLLWLLALGLMLVLGSFALRRVVSR